MAQTNNYIKFNPDGLGAYVFVNPSEPIEGALLNPNTSKVRRLPPEFWKLVEDKILPMTKEEQQLVMLENNTKEHFLRKTKHIVIDWPLEVIVDRPVEVFVDRPVEVIKEVEVEKIVKVEVIKEVKVPVFVPQEKIVEKIVRVEVPVQVIQEVEVIKYIEKKRYLVLAGIAILLQLYNLIRSFNG